MQSYESELLFKQQQWERYSIPAWAKAEHMEMSVPEKELWRYGADAVQPPAKRRRRRSVLLTLTAALDRFSKSI